MVVRGVQRELEQFAQRRLVERLGAELLRASAARESRSLRPRRLTVPVWSNGLPMAQTVEQLADDKVKLTVEVPAHDVHHAVEHAANDLAATVAHPRLPQGQGADGRSSMQRVGKERLYAEAVESHIGELVLERGHARARQPGRAARVRLRPAGERRARTGASRPTFAVQPKPEPADWTTLEVPKHEAEVPQEAVDRGARGAAAHRSPSSSRSRAGPAQDGRHRRRRHRRRGRLRAARLRRRARLRAARRGDRERDHAASASARAARSPTSSATAAAAAPPSSSRS